MNKTCYTCRKPATWRLFLTNPKSYALACEDHLRPYLEGPRWVTVARITTAESEPAEQVAS